MSLAASSYNPLRNNKQLSGKCMEYILALPHPKNNNVLYKNLPSYTNATAAPRLLE